jgi:hypothetical protein
MTELTYEQELEQRVAWLERKVVRLIWTVIQLASWGIGALVFLVVKDRLGNWGALAVAFIVWALVGWFVQRSEFKGAPSHIKFIDP